MDLSCGCAGGKDFVGVDGVGCRAAWAPGHFSLCAVPFKVYPGIGRTAALSRKAVSLNATDYLGKLGIGPWAKPTIGYSGGRIEHLGCQHAVQPPTRWFLSIPRRPSYGYSGPIASSRGGQSDHLHSFQAATFPPPLPSITNDEKIQRAPEIHSTSPPFMDSLLGSRPGSPHESERFLESESDFSAPEKARGRLDWGNVLTRKPQWSMVAPWLLSTVLLVFLILERRAKSIDSGYWKRYELGI